VCYSHGGNARQSKAAAKRRLEAAALEKALVTYGGPRRNIGPVETMVEVLQWAATHMVWLREMIVTFTPEALVWGVADEVDKGSGEFPGVDVRRVAAPSVWLLRYDIERKIALDASDRLARLGMEWDEREAVRRQGATLAKVFREGVRLLGHDPNSPEVGRAFSQALRSVVPGVDPDKVIEGKVA